MGLVLEWVYGSIVSTAEKSRDGAKRCLGLTPPTAQQAYDNLVRCLEDQAAWEGRAKEVRCCTWFRGLGNRKTASPELLA
jgi:hypothetical protein